MPANSSRLPDASVQGKLAKGIQRLLCSHAEGGVAPDGLAAAQPDATPFALSEMQEAYWIGRRGDLTLGGSSIHSYHEAELPDIDLERLEAAWTRLVRRHEMLRAVLTDDGRQRVLAEVTVPPIGCEDLRGMDPQARDGRLDRIRREMSERRHVLEEWPLWEIRATRLDGGVTRLHIGIDGIVVDDRSYQIIVREWLLLYEGLDHELPALHFTFREYLRREAALRQSDDYRRSLDYWLDRIERLPPSPQLPMIADPAQVTRLQFRRRQAELSRAEWTRIKAVGEAAGVRPATLLLAAFMEVLSRWSAEPDLTVSVPTFNRLPLHPQVNDVVGEFGSFVLAGNEGLAGLAFGERLARLQDRLWEAFDNARVSGVRLLRELARKSGSAEPVRMPVVFTMASNLDRGRPSSRPVRRVAQTFGITRTPQVLVDHQAAEIGGALHFNWDCVDQVFPDGMIGDMFEAYAALLRRIAGDAGIWQEPHPVRLPSWQQAERDAANATCAAVPAELLHAALDRMARTSPERPAILMAGQAMSFGELDVRARDVATRLLREGVTPGDIVAVLAAPGWEQAVAVLGILRTGAAYLPVGADLPARRRETLLAAGKVRVVVAPAGLCGDVARPAGRVLLPVGAALPAPCPPARVCVAPDAPAYVLFTSGSTGEPKGVVVSHRAAVNTLHDINSRFGVTRNDRVLGLSQLSFDLSVYDIFGVLGAGGSLVVPASGEERNPVAWLALCSECRVSLWNSVPALFQLAVQYAEDTAQKVPSSVRLALLSGDWIPPSLPERARAAAAGSLTVAGLGGATEAAIWSVCGVIDTLPPDWPSFPYGRPMANQTVHVVGPDLQDRPVWVPGRLVIGGAGLAIGYLDDPGKTAETFLGGTGQLPRRYDTGDIARYRPGGEIEFLGRVDRQVKVNGYRVELREVEAVLARHASVMSAAVVSDGRRLTAFMVPVGGGGERAAAVARFAGEQLPRHMVPQSLRWLPQLPLTREGKVDYRELRRLSGTADAPSGKPAAPGVLERLVAQVLERERVDPDASLVALGASSMEMIRLSTLVQRELGVEIPLIDLMQAGSVRALQAKFGPGAEPAATPQPATVHRPASEVCFEIEPADVAGATASRRCLDAGRAHPGRALMPLPRAVAAPALPEAPMRSYRRFPLRPIPFGAFVRLLEPLAAGMEHGVPRFQYGSAGNLYPVELYCEVKPGRLQGLLPGIYQYNPLRHCLDERLPGWAIDPAAFGPKNRPIIQEAAFVLVLVGMMSAARAQYGHDAATALAMYEAGSIGQLLRGAASRTGLGLCSVATMEFGALRHALGLGADAVCLHILAGGLAEPAPDASVASAEGAGVLARLDDLARRVQRLDENEASSLLAMIEAGRS